MFLRSNSTSSTSNTRQTELLSKYNVVISGGGPAALMTAWEALKSKKSVLLVSDREMQFFRVQRITLYSENKKYLLDMLMDENGEFRQFDSEKDEADIKFIIELINSSSIAVKDIEHFLKRRLDELNTAEHAISYIEKSQFKTIKMFEGCVTIESVNHAQEDRDIQFDYIVGADGGAHHAVNVLNSSLARKRIDYKAMAKPNHPTHASAYITIEREDGENIALPAKQAIASSADLTWILQFDPFSRNFAEKNQVKCFFNGEVPENIFDAINYINQDVDDDNSSKKSAVIAHIQETIQKYFDKENLNNGAKLKVELVKPSAKHEIKKDKLKLQAYTVKPFLANQSVLIAGEKVFIIVGDAVRGANYQFGNGLNRAGDQARRIGEVFQNKKSAEEYDAQSDCNSFLPLDFEITTKFTNIPICRRLLLGSGIEDAIESSHKKFLKQHETIIEKLKSQEVISSAEQQMNSPKTRMEIS